VCSFLVSIRKIDYPEFQGIMALPSTYEAWLIGHSARNGDRENDEVVQVYTVLPSVFREYLTEHGKAASEVELRHCAMDIVQHFGDLYQPLPTSCGEHDPVPLTQEP
jgi:hypothetical protein